jgi:hypothetical protein
VELRVSGAAALCTMHSLLLAQALLGPLICVFFVCQLSVMRSFACLSIFPLSYPPCLVAFLLLLHSVVLLVVTFFIVPQEHSAALRCFLLEAFWDVMMWMWHV